MAENNGKVKRWWLRGLILLRFGRLEDFCQITGIPKSNASQVLNVRFDPNPRELEIYEDTFGERWETLGVAQSLSDYHKRFSGKYRVAMVRKEVS